MEGELTLWLKQKATNGLIYRGPRQSIPGFNQNLSQGNNIGFRSDGLLTDEKSLLALEIEAAQKHPDTNVGKYWLLQKTHPYKKIVLVHVYTPRFNSYGWRKELGNFYAEMMGKMPQFSYHQLDFSYPADPTYQHVAKTTKQTLQGHIEQLFPKK